jgi:membrane protease YdiL (CAAX protease family)
MTLQTPTLSMLDLAGTLTLPGVLAVAVLIGLGVWHARQADAGWPALMFGVLALAMAVHAVPGFHNPLIFDAVTLNPAARPFTLYVSVDKGLAGLCLLVFASRAGPHALSGAPLWRAVAVSGLATMGLVMGLGWWMGLVRPAPVWLSVPQWMEVAGPFLLVNLLITCVAEEAFFRGLLQGWLTRWLNRRLARQSPWVWMAVALPALLFGLMHLGGGWRYALLAGVAGFGYGVARHVTGRVGAAVAVHFALNATHFLFFTYPLLA